MQPFDYVRPRDFAEASWMLAAGSGRTRALMGGTDLIIRARGGFAHFERVVDLKDLPGMREIRPAADGGLIIGAACTMNQVARHPVVAECYHLLAGACNSVASYQLRNRATVGGNCCNASPAADTAPALYCLDAVMEVYGPRGTRCIPIADFFAGPGRTAMDPGEFLIAIQLPPGFSGQAARIAGAYNKLGRTRLGDIATASVAVLGWPADTPSGTDWRIALGAVAPTPLRTPQAEDALAGDTSPAGIAAAAEMAAAAARPISDVRASAAYRRAMIGVLTRRGIEAVLASLNQGGIA